MSNEDTTRDDSGMNEPRREHNCMGAQMKNWTKGCCMHVLVGTCWYMYMYSTVYFCSVGKTKVAKSTTCTSTARVSDEPSCSAARRSVVAHNSAAA